MNLAGHFDSVLGIVSAGQHAMVKDLLEAVMQEERALYLEQHPTKANGYYTRDLLTYYEV